MAFEATALESDGVGLGRRGSWQVARTAARVAAPEQPRLPGPSIADGPPVAGENPGRSFSRRGPETLRGHRRRRARGGALPCSWNSAR